MSKIVLDTQSLQTIALFEQVTGARVKDCIPGEGVLVFVVEIGDMAKAIGKGGQHVRLLEHKLKKRVRVVEFNDDLVRFVQNVIAPLEVSEVRPEDKVLFLAAKDLKTRGLLIGRGASNLRFFEAIVKRYFPIEELRVA
ncbi:NusA-like transcription termination signal-binding factor [Candidatus Woesearchaeota archaeon]|nr:NusA-like transcription termination signal-binding factor [Candidatus Woesearchaeota archaeon]